jgi:hypothetical protein
MAQSGERATSAPMLIARNLVFIEVLPNGLVELYPLQTSTVWPLRMN